MAWARVDDGWWCHPKVMDCDLAARGLWVSALSWSCAQRRSMVPGSLVAMLGASEAEAKQLEASGLWVRVDGGWEIHDWSEYQQLSLSEKRAEAGRKGGRRSRPPAETQAKPKQAASKAEAKAEAGTQPNPTQPNPSTPNPLLGSEPGLALVPVPDAQPEVERPAYSDAFEEFWQRCPRKVGKGAAAKAFAKAARTPLAAAGITRAMEAHAAAWERWPAEDQQFIPHPSTWLNEGRYDDPPPTVRRSSGPRTKADRNLDTIAESVARMTGGAS